MGGWNSAGPWGWQVRRDDAAGPLARAPGRWTLPDVGVTILGFYLYWPLGLAFIALKLWHQASGAPGSVFTFAHEKWEALVALTRGVMSGAALPAMPFGVKSSGSEAFDAWRRTELDRIEAERAKLRRAEREFASYREELLYKDREHFDRFMRERGGTPPI